MEARATRISLGVWTVLVVLFLWLPLVLICVYAFNSSNIQSWPIAGLQHQVVPRSAWHNEEARSALVLSLKAGRIATAIAVVLGTAAASPSAASASSGGTPSRFCSSCRSRCPAS